MQKIGKVATADAPYEDAPQLPQCKRDAIVPSLSAAAMCLAHYCIQKMVTSNAAQRHGLTG